MTVRIEERHAAIPTGDGPMKAFVAYPAGAGPFGAVIMVQHIGGLSETMKAQARRCAAEGYLCVVPALYHRLGDIVIDPVSTDEAVATIRAIAVASLRPPQVLADIAATLAWLQAEPMVRLGPRALTGYGGGAGLALLAAGTDPASFRAMASILGVGFIKEGVADSPHRKLDALGSELYFAFAGEDEIIPATAVEALRDLLAGSAVPHRIRVHPGVRHGYAFPERDTYSAPAAEADWAEIGAMLRRRLA